MKLSLLLVLVCAVLGDKYVSLGIVNEFSVPIDVYWVDPMGKEHLNAQGVKPLDPHWILSFKDHQFRARDPETGEVLSEHIVESNEQWVVRNPSAAFSNCPYDSKDTTEYSKCFAEKSDWVELDEGLQKHRQRSHEDRLASNEGHQKIVPAFTKMGFKKIKVPEEMWKIVQEYYTHNKKNHVREDWGSTNTVINFWKSPTYMIHLPEMGDIKPRLYEHSRKILEEWIGGEIALEPTSMYGIRIYLNDAILENHVDRLSTHAVSAIINVDQDVDEPWPLEIYDHEGNKHLITMEPGDMVLYESAKAVHGRPSYFKGRYYANFFVHFRPKDKSIWNYSSDNFRESMDKESLVDRVKGALGFA